MEQAHVPALGSWTSSPVHLSIPNRTGDPKDWQVAITPRTPPCTTRSSRSGSSLVTASFSTGKTSGKFTLQHQKPGGLSCCGMAANSKGQTLAPFHASSPPQALGGDGALSQCPHHVGYMGTFTPVF